MRSAYEGEIPCLPATCKRALPAISRAGRAPTGEWRGWRSVGGSHPRIAPGHPAIADKVRSYGGGIPCLPATCRSGPCPRIARRARSYRGMARVAQRRSGSYPRIAPGRPAIADKVRSYPLRTGTAPRRMVLSEAIPITTTAWVSQSQPILRKAARRSRVGVSASAAMSPGAAQLSDLPCTSSFMRVRPMWRTSVPRTR